jgi:CheY-like chemotaxis protein
MSEYLTTGEAAQILHISRSTISRKYDLGILRGKTNAVTGERMISRESVLAFIKQYNLPSELLPGGPRQVIVCSRDETFLALVKQAFAHDQRLQFHISRFGADALVACSKATHDLLLLDEDTSDIPFVEIIRSLRRSEYTREKPVLVCCTQTDRKTCLQEGADEALPKALLEAGVFTTALYALLKMPRETVPDRRQFEHQRQWPRIPLNIPVRLFIYKVAAPRQREPGQAMTENISRGGLLLSHLHIRGGLLPLEPFRILVEADQAPLEQWRAHCQLIRLQSVGTLTAALQFVKISKPNLQKIMSIAGA